MGTRILIAITLLGPIFLLTSLGAFGVGQSILSENTGNPASDIGTNAGGIKGDCGNPNVSQYAEFINAAALQFNVPAPVIAGVIEQESGGNREAYNEGSQATGLMQVLPSTWADIRAGSVAPDPNNPTVKVTATKNRAGEKLPDNQKDPQAAIYAGTFYLRQMLTYYHGYLPMALGAYNAGAGNVDDYSAHTRWSEPIKYIYNITTKWMPQYQKCLEKVSTSTTTVSSKIGDLTPAAKKVYDYVIANPDAADQMRNGTGGSGCALTVKAVLRTNFGIDGSTGNRLADGTWGRTDPPTAENIKDVQTALAEGDLPVWHINGTNKGEHWIVVLKIDSNGTVHYFNPAGGVIEQQPVTAITNLDSGEQVAYFGMSQFDQSERGRRGYRFPVPKGK